MAVRQKNIDYLYKWAMVATSPITNPKGELVFVDLEKTLYAAGIRTRLVKKTNNEYHLYVPLEFAKCAKDLATGAVTDIVGEPLRRYQMFESDFSVKNKKSILDPRPSDRVRINIRRSWVFLFLTALIIFTAAYFVWPIIK